MNPPRDAPPQSDRGPVPAGIDNTIGQSILEKIGTSPPEFTREVNNPDDHDRPTEDVSDVATRFTPICDRCGLPIFGSSCQHCNLAGPWQWKHIPGSGGRKR